MRILHVGKFYPPFHGGIETAVRSLAEGLVTRGHQVTVLCANERSVFAEDIIEGVHVVRLPYHGSVFSQQIVSQFPKWFERFSNTADLIHFHSPNPAAEFTSVMKRKTKGIVVTHHSEIIRQELLLPLYAPLYGRFLERADAIAVSSRHALHTSRLVARFTHKIHAIPFGLSDFDYQRTPANDAQIRDLKARIGNFVLFLGRLVEYKGLDYLLYALKKINTRVVIVGDGPSRAHLETLARHLDLGSKVIFTGSLQHDEMLSYLHACEAMVLPAVTPNEAFGISLIEGMICKKPLITTRLASGVNFVNIDRQTGLVVPPRDPMALADAIQRLMENEPFRRRLGNAAHERFESHFAQARMVKAYENLYDQVRLREIMPSLSLG